MSRAVLSVTGIAAMANLFPLTTMDADWHGTSKFEHSG